MLQYWLPVHYTGLTLFFCITVIIMAVLTSERLVASLLLVKPLVRPVPFLLMLLLISAAMLLPSPSLLMFSIVAAGVATVFDRAAVCGCTGRWPD